MNPYEKVFRAFVTNLDRSSLIREAHIFYVDQVRTILNWTDLGDAKQLAEIRKLDSAFRLVVNP
ncbi:hypothetical protein J6TS7_65690 [Paenibacillus dendritiformis]|uniref:hypothetical protein n=1 Tax=Paenibacillus TaxID=44249 RepID=UPI001B17669D|nr:hypothetical protein [Paenibacillus dendritiformis]GIO82959.1 hypothetical protein J6TS7_65690 [Paenibacillus dendritiformis]